VIQSIGAAQLGALRQFDGGTIANAIETFDLRLRNEGFANGTIRCLLPERSSAAGYAVTARIRCSSPPPVGHSYHDRTDWWSYIVSVPAPRFVVVQDIDDHPGVGAFVGDVHANVLRALGCVAYATNGSVRDVDAVARIDFQLFASAVSVSHAFSHLIDFAQPVEIGGLTVASGDVLFGDRHGIQSIPPSILDRLPGAAAAVAAKDRQVIQLCQSPDFSIDRLRALVRNLE